LEFEIDSPTWLELRIGPFLQKGEECHLTIPTPMVLVGPTYPGISTPEVKSTIAEIYDYSG